MSFSSRCTIFLHDANELARSVLYGLCTRIRDNPVVLLESHETNLSGATVMIFAGEGTTHSNDLVTRVKLSLGKLSYHQLDAVDCQVDDQCHITLKGNLRSYYLKQIAQAIALKVPGVRTVSNEILVMD